MEWIDKSYILVWDKTPPIAREPKSSESSKDNHEFVTKAIADVLDAEAASLLSTAVRQLSLAL
jgi:hypothetical protein